MLVGLRAKGLSCTTRRHHEDSGFQRMYYLSLRERTSGAGVAGELLAVDLSRFEIPVTTAQKACMWPQNYGMGERWEMSEIHPCE